MEIRVPNMRYDAVEAHWAPDREFAQTLNGSSMIPAHLEPYLVKVMRRAKAALDPKHVALHKDLAVFIRQEMQHCKQHLAFNQRLRENGYPGLAAIEAEYAADYERFLAEKPLRWNLAYSEGFEAMSSIAVTVFFEEYDEYYQGADQSVVNLWKWHLAEEYEHREVAHDLYHAMSGLNPVSAYFYRVYGFFTAVRHIRSYGKRFTAYLLEIDRENMTPAEREASEARVARLAQINRKRARRHLLEIISPFYQPRNRRPPRGLASFMAGFEGSYSIARAA